MFTEIDGRRYFTASFGAAPRTFLAHSGWIGSWEDWLGVLEVLSRSWWAVAYDHRGAGDTRLPLEEITRTALVEDIFRVIDHFEIERCVLGGFSSGSLIALLAVLERPERFDGLVLLNSSLRLLGVPTSPPAASPPPPPADFGARMRETIVRMTPEPDDEVEHIRRWAQHHILMNSDTPTESAVRAAFGYRDLDLAPRLREIAVPTLLIHGAKDSLADAASVEYMAAQIPQSELVVFDESGHLPAMTRPDEVADAINRFFASI